MPSWERRLGAIACVEHLQLCNDFDGGRECSSWVGVLKGENNEISFEGFYNRCSKDDKGLISLIMSRRSGLTIGQLASGSGSALVASQSLLSVPFLGGRMVDVQTAHGDEQWKTEASQCTLSRENHRALLQNWPLTKILISGFNLVLATMQLGLLYISIGTPFLNTSILVDEMPDESRFICDNVKIHTFRNTSIRWLGVVMIIFWAILVTALSSPGKTLACLSRLLDWERGKRQAEMWFLDSYYHSLLGKDSAADGAPSESANTSYGAVSLRE